MIIASYHSQLFSLMKFDHWLFRTHLQGGGCICSLWGSPTRQVVSDKKAVKERGGLLVKFTKAQMMWNVRNAEGLKTEAGRRAFPPASSMRLDLHLILSHLMIFLNYYYIRQGKAEEGEYVTPDFFKQNPRKQFRASTVPNSILPNVHNI